MPLLAQFQRDLQRHTLVRGGECVVVAVSGGPDSLCLLHLLWRLRAELGLRLHVAHLDHAFRGDESAAEARFVYAFAQRLGLPATIERRDVATLMAGTATNKLAAARTIRYAFLAEVAQREGAEAVAVAHQADDQAETVLMHLLRGAGPAGLRGMRQRVQWNEWAAGLPTSGEIQPDLIRPLLETSRDAIEAYCAEHHLDPRHDPSNESLTYTRSRVRIELLPLLKGYNSHISAALAHTARICADDFEYLQSELEARWPTLTQEAEGHITFDSSAWNALHPALQRYALRRVVDRLAPGKDVHFEQIEALRQFLNSGGGLQPNLPGGIRFSLTERTLTFMSAHIGAATETQAAAPQILTPQELQVPGSSDLGGWRLWIDSSEPVDWVADRWHSVLDADKIVGSLILRGRQPTDRFWPEGGVGSKRLQDFFVDRKISRVLRDHWPLVTCHEDLVWIVGLRADRRFCCDTTTRRRLWLWVKPSIENSISP